MGELQMYLAAIMPFGTPGDTNAPNIKSIKRFGFPVSSSIPPSDSKVAHCLYLPLLMPNQALFHFYFMCFVIISVRHGNLTFTEANKDWSS